MNTDVSAIKKTCPRFFVKMGEIMSDPEFRKFFDENFNNWNDVKTVIMFMKTYQFIENEYTVKTGEIMKSSEIAVLIREMFSNKEYRRFIVDNMSNFIEDKPCHSSIIKFLPNKLLGDR